ncbi:MAG: hypothetical protein AAGB05_16590 [Pseudomonadota bacterium]
MSDTCTPWDGILLTTAALALGGLGLATLGTTPLGPVDRGWADGTYQRGYENRFEEALPTAQSAAQLFAALKLALLGEAAEGAILGSDGWLFTAEEFSAPIETRDLTSELLRVRAMLGSGTALLPVIIPDKARIMAEMLARSRSGPFTARYDAALESIEAVGLPALDLRPALDAAGTPFLRTDTHWSPAGAEAAAAEVGAAVAKHGPDLTKAKSALTATGVVPFEGDLRAFVDTGHWIALASVPVERIETFRTEITTQGGLFGDAPVEIVLVGTSFSARAEFHFEGFLKHHLSADVLNLAQVGLGPFVPMDHALAALERLPTPPRLIIWEVPERYLALSQHP